MQLRQVRHFLAVVEHGSFTAAARALLIAQPSLSQSIQRLEQHLGQDLFVRTPRGAGLTPSGEAFLAEARRLREHLERTTDLAGRIANLQSGQLRVLTIGTLTIDPLPTIVQRFRQRFPGVHVHIASASTPGRLLQDLAKGAADLGFTEISRPTATFAITPVADQELVLALPPAGPDLPDPLPLAELSSVEFVALSGEPALHRGSERSLWGHPLRVRVETSTWGGVLALVQAGAGAAILARPVAERHFPPQRLRRLEPATVRRVGFLHRPDDLSVTGSALLEHLDPPRPIPEG